METLAVLDRMAQAWDNREHLPQHSAHESMKLVPLDPFGDKKKTLITLQWLVVLATSYFLLFQRGQVVEDPLVLYLVSALLVSIFVLHRLPRSAFDHRFTAPCLVLMDTVLISLAIGLKQESPWDLLLIFYFALFIAAIGETLTKIVVGCLIISIVSIIGSSGMNFSSLDADALFRIPFLFGASILYGYLAEEARREKQQVTKVQETETLKRQLVSALAHDIKNPLWVIMGSAEMVAADLENKSGKKEHLDALERIQENSQRIVKLVTGFLDASRAETGRLEIEPKPFHLNILAREVGQQLIGELNRKEISLRLELNNQLPEIMGDEEQIDRVLWNLLGNAVKFTPRGGTVTVSSRVEGDHACLSVRDTGTGIPKEELSLLFTEFRRRKTAQTEKVEGTGLGLFIVKTIVEAHGGTVEAASEPGQGSTFTVRLPLNARRPRRGA